MIAGSDDVTTVTIFPPAESPIIMKISLLILILESSALAYSHLVASIASLTPFKVMSEFKLQFIYK
jgi:hypothetical protein